MRHILSTLAILFIFTFTLSAQETFNSSPYQNLYKGNNTNNYNDISGLPLVKEKSLEQLNIENQIYSLRQLNDRANNYRLEELNNRLSILNGNVVKLGEYYGAGATPANNNPLIEGDNIGNTRIYNNTSNTIKGVATATEQIGTHAGRIWVVYAYSANGASPDTLRVIYSDDGGISYTNYSFIHLGGTDKVNNDGLDIEIIENTTGDKYLWCTYGLRSTGGTGNWFVGGFNMDITTFAASFWVLSWPGNNASNRYYNIRLTSDNANYLSNAYIYMVCSFDSTTASGHYTTQKFARCTSPYVSTAPTFSYLPGKFWWYNTVADNNIRTLYSDIAYINNIAADSIIVSFSGVPDSTKVFFAKCDISGTAPTSGQYQAGSDATDYKTYARLSTNGNTNGSVICVFNQFSPNRNVKYFRSNTFGDFSNPAQSILWGSSVNTNYQPDIVGRRNAYVHYFAFSTIASSDSVHYVSVTNTGSTTHYYKMNSVALTSGTQGPKPGFRFVGGDSCYVLYSETGPNNVWSAAGCSGATIGVGNENEVPFNYSLKQNFPNPFNPTTTIEYSIAKTGLVKLVVYDLLGKEVVVLVNDVKNAGKYIVDFNASSLSSGIYFYKISSGEFSTVKKMLFIK